MVRPRAVTCFAAVCCLASSSCYGDVDLFTSSRAILPAADAGLMEPEGMAPPPFVSVPPAVTNEGTPPIAVPPLAPAVPASRPDAGAPEPEPDAGPAPALPEPVLASPAVELELLGVAEGEPRLGTCPGGVIIGVRTTANPSEENFGQRLTFLEPICGQVLLQGSELAAASGTLSVTREDAIITWSEADPFQGLPPTEVPDPRLTWVPQPASICPPATPVVVGLSGEYDPVAPDVTNTAAIRSLFLECAPLLLAPNGIDVSADTAGHQLISNADAFSARGSETYRSSCEGGSVTTQIQVQAGFWLDGFVLGCSGLSVTPLP